MNGVFRHNLLQSKTFRRAGDRSCQPERGLRPGDGLIDPIPLESWPREVGETARHPEYHGALERRGTRKIIARTRASCSDAPERGVKATRIHPGREPPACPRAAWQGDLRSEALADPAVVIRDETPASPDSFRLANPNPEARSAPRPQRRSVAARPTSSSGVI